MANFYVILISQVYRLFHEAIINLQKSAVDFSKVLKFKYTIPERRWKIIIKFWIK